MSTVLQRAAAVAAAVVIMLALAWASAVPLTQHAPGSARLRLSWSARPERIEVCRTLSAEELEKVAEHMRQRVACEGVHATYLLRVEVDSALLGESIVRGGGLRHDRPIFLLRDYAVPPGAHRFRVTLTRREQTDDDAAAFAKAVVPDVDTGLFAGRAQREAAEHARRARSAIPARLVLDTVAELPSMRVGLVRLDAGTRRLELRVR